jgi:hypothetical protein
MTSDQPPTPLQPPTPTAPPPGWYPNPEPGVGGQRYWDGTTWTDQMAAHQQPQALPPQGPFPAAFWVTIVALVGMVVGAVGPWVTAPGISATGTTGGRDGSVVLVAAVISAILVVLYATKRTRDGCLVAVVVIGIISTIICIADVADISNKSDEFPGVGLSAGWGIYIALAGSAVAALAALVTWRAARAQRA